MKKKNRKLAERSETKRIYIHEREKLEDKVDSVVYIHIRKL